MRQEKEKALHSTNKSLAKHRILLFFCACECSARVYKLASQAGGLGVLGSLCKYKHALFHPRQSMGAQACPTQPFLFLHFGHVFLREACCFLWKTGHISLEIQGFYD